MPDADAAEAGSEADEAGSEADDDTAPPGPTPPG
jgi:hypothetical protein